LLLVLRLTALMLCVHTFVASRARADAVTAQQHFEAGVRAFDEQRLADAATEFQRAYASEPAWQVLYNLGSVHAALGDAVAAQESFERYLQQADATVTPERRERVALELARQRARIGTLLLRAEPNGAELRVDAKPAGTAPVAQPIRLVAGTHTIDLSRVGFRSARRDVEIVAGRQTELTLALEQEYAGAPSAVLERRAVAERSGTGTVQRVVGWTLGAAALGGLAAGTVLMVKAHYKHLDALELVNADRRPLAEELESKAERQQTLGIAVLGVSGAVFIASAIVLWSAPSPPYSTAQLKLAPWVSAGSSGLIARAQF
jgi:tetratricopeptide (TPR) repeat protein